jgi:hypothetical protein
VICVLGSYLIKHAQSYPQNDLGHYAAQIVSARLALESWKA